MKTLIAIATYNEYENISLLLVSIFKENLNSDILFIDDNSQDNTEKAIRLYQEKKTNIKLISREKKMGVGSAHLKALEFAYSNKYDLLVTMDADFTHNPKYIKQMLKLNESYPVVIGSRHIEKDSLKSWPLPRKLLTYSAYYVTKNFLNIDFDSTNGFRSYNLKIINQNIFNKIKSQSYSFFIETSFVLNKELNVKSIPIEMPIRFAEKSKMKIIDMFVTILLIIKLFFKRFL
jgi:dolichol-phosphate mannosyltransferase